MCCRTVMYLIVWVATVGHCWASERTHHIYKTGMSADACTPQDFQQSYWTGGDKNEFEGSALVGTAYAQALIWEHQHPTDCFKERFLIWIATTHGIGSNLHVLGQALVVAMTLKRVLLVAEDQSHPYFDTAYCANHSSYHDCYFDPVSSCTLSHAAAALGVGQLQYADLPDVPKIEQDRPEEVVVRLTNIPHFKDSYPPIFKHFLEKSPIDPSKTQYWWRAQSVAFLLRPNAKTLAAVEERKLSTFPSKIGRGTISCHIRHGDKWKESEEVEDATYVETLEKVYQVANAQGQHLKRDIFLSTDDPESVNHFKSLALWQTAFVEVQRKPDRQKSTLDYARELGPANDMINSLVNLDLALHCDAWVGTLSSNWCRLIDELRSTVRCKAWGLYWDAQQGFPPTDLNWK